MNRFKNEKDYFHGKQEHIGVLLVNLGTPDAPDTKSVRRYLREFLSDPRVVEIPRLIWYPILYGFILPKRPAESAKKYQSIWTDNGSPLLHISEQQAKKLQHELDMRTHGETKVELAMRYGKPSISNGLRKLKQAGAQRILVLPLYPQYSATTTASIFDAVFDELKQWRWMPEMRLVNHYHDHPKYIEALANKVRAFQQKQGTAEKLVMSFHGIPKRNLELGDPYFCESMKTGRLLAEALHLKEDEYVITFQSRFGKAEWLKPYTDKTLEQLAKAGTKSVQVICPGFAADCLETLEEIEEENREYFLEAGGKEYAYIPALNDDLEHIHALLEVIEQHTQGWGNLKDSWGKAQTRYDPKLSKQQAMKRGAKQ